MLCSIVSYANLDNFIYLGEHNNSSYYCSNTNNFTWHEANAAAQSYGGHLAIVDNAAENEFIRSSIMADYVWIGLTDENSEGNYSDVFGNPCSYYNWSTGEPNNLNGTEHYVRLLRNNGHWTDRDQWFEAEFIVEIPNTSNPAPECESVPNSVGDFIFLGEYNNSKYFCSNSSHYTWHEARAAAESNGGHLAIVESHEENEFIRSSILADYVWLGVTDEASEGNYSDVFGNPCSYYNWNSGEPNNLDGQEHYVRLLRNNGHWTDRNQWFEAEFIMEMPCNNDNECQDSDNDGVCDVNDCAPNNPNKPTTPGTACNDGNNNTQNDIIQADGCTCQGSSISNPNGNITVNAGPNQAICPDEQVTLTANYSNESTCELPCNLGTGQLISKWDMEDCWSLSGDNSGSIYSEFDANVSNLSCASAVASNLYRFEGNHSCTDDAINGDPGDAVCLGMNDNFFSDNAAKALRFDVTIDPANCLSGITKLSFKQFAPSHYTWSQSGYNDNTGQNNYPTKYGIRVLRDGVEIFKQTNLNTATSNWATKTFNFSGPEFQSATVALYRFELLAYAPVGNGASVSAWDLDEIKVFGGSCNPQTDNSVDYLWSNGSTNATIQVAPGSTTTYTVTVTDCTGDTDTDDVTVTIKDADQDGVCTDVDCDDNNANLPTTPGTACNDNDPTTVNDVILADGCACAGTFDPCALLGGDTDGDGICDDEDCAPNNAALPTTVGTACNDNDPTTVNDVILADGCACVGTFDPCALLGGDTDGDGICDDEDCAPNNAALPTTPGTACDDGDAATENDVILADGCACEGTEIVIPGISIDDVVVNEEDGTAVLNICLDEATTVDVTVDFATGNNSALQGSDYVTQSGTVTIEAGELCATVTIELVDDANPESTEELTVNLSNPTNGELTDDEGTITILDTDVIIPGISIDDVVVNEEDGTATLKICLDEATTVDVTVDYATGDDSALQGSDYVTQSGTVTIEAGELCAMVVIDLIDDAAPEDTEVLVVDLSNPSNSEIVDEQGTVTILDTDVITPTITIDDVVVNEEDGTAVLTICSDVTSLGLIVVNYTTTDGSAVEGVDYVDVSGVAVITPGELCTTVVIDIIDDENSEDTEVLTVVLSDLNNGVIGDDEGTVTILDTDVEVCEAIAGTMLADQAEVEYVGGDVVISATPNGGAVIPADFTQIFVLTQGDDLVIIDAGADAQFTVSELGKYTIHSLVYNPSTLDLSIVQFGTTTGFDVNGLLQQGGGDICAALDVAGAMIFLVEPTPLPNLGINDITVNEEDGTATLEICLDAVSDEAITVDFATADGSANEGSDYTGVSGSVTIEAGELCADVIVAILDDENPETTEELVVNLSNPTGAEIADDQGTVTILDTDVVDANCDAITIENIDGTIVAQGFDAPIVFVKVYDSNWNNVFDSGMITDNAAESVSGLPAGEYWVFVKTYDTNWNELCDIHETVVIEGVIGNDPNLAINDLTVNEEDGTATLEICLDAVSDEAVTVDFATADGSANEGSDYTGVVGTVTIEAGELCADVTIPLVDDAAPESTEELVVNLSNPSGANLADDQGIVTILDTDVLVNDPLITISDLTVNEEDGLATLAICLDAVSDENVTVDYTTNDGAAIAGEDYLASSGSVTIPAGMLCMIVDFPILDDENPESTETFDVVLSNPNGGVINDGTGVVTILDTDTDPDGCSSIYINANDAVITVGGYADPIAFVKVYDGNWNLVYNSGMLTNNETQTITITESDTYWVFVKTYDNGWNQLCDTHETFNIICGDVCADFGGDTDGDGVCDDNDLCPGGDDNIDTNGNGIPDDCDTIDPDVCIERTVSSTNLCAGDTDYSFFIRFENTHYYYQFTDAATFTEYTDGTALLTGTIQNNEIPSLQFEIDVLYSGRTIDAPVDSPKEHVCLDVDTDLFYFYPTVEGTLTGIEGAEGAVITMEAFGPSFQVGLGANVTHTTDEYGASGWMTMEILSQPTTGDALSFEASNSGEGDVNIMLSGDYEDCLDVAITAPATSAGTSPCNVEVTSGDGTLSIGGYTQPVAIIQVFDAQWSPVFSCMGDCANPLVIDDLATGTYFVKVSLYDENWNMECEETEGYYGVVNTFGLETLGAEILFFNAAKDGNNVSLNWTTNTEYKNDYFVVERSTDGLNFETALDVSSFRDNDAAISYNDLDTDPLRGKSFYRLKQVYNDGTHRYSNIRTIEFELGLLDFTVYPNPTVDQLFINLKEFEGEAATVVIYNTLGEQMNTYTTESLTTDAIEFNVSDLNGGMYSISARIGDRKVLTRMFVVAKK